MEGAPWGGSEELWSAVAKSARTCGYDVRASINYWTHSPHQWQGLIAEGVELVTRTDRSKFASHMAHILSPPPDLVLLSLGDNGASALQYAEGLLRLAIPLYIICHNAAEWWWWSDNIADRIRRCFTQARAVYFVSRHNLELTERFLGAKISNATVVWNPLSINPQSTLSWPLCAEARLACVGRLQPAYKGQDILMLILSRPEWRQRDFRVSFYGTGDCELALKRLATSLDIRADAFRGYVSSERLWAEEQILVLPSRSEGMPLVLQEAMYLGRPAVVTDVGGNADLVIDGLTGFIADAATAKHFTEALDRAWLARSRWQEMGQAAAASVRQRLPLDPGSQLLTLMQDLL
jgi:glycosyltransferase involved in cell wall biosynthesis